MSPVNQLYCFCSITLGSFNCGGIYFSKNSMQYLISNRNKILDNNIRIFNKFLKKCKMFIKLANSADSGSTVNLLLKWDAGNNWWVNNTFHIAQQVSSPRLDLADIMILKSRNKAIYLMTVANYIKMKLKKHLNFSIYWLIVTIRLVTWQTEKKSTIFFFFQFWMDWTKSSRD